jgi:hypothetical protein
VKPVASLLDRWTVNTRLCPTWDLAIETTLQTLLNTRHVMMWPVGNGNWMIIAAFEIKPN